MEYFKELQHIFESVSKQKEKVRPMHDAGNRTKTFFNFERDHLQKRMELMRTLSQCEGKRRIRPIHRQFGEFYFQIVGYLSCGPRQRPLPEFQTHTKGEAPCKIIRQRRSRASNWPA